MKFIDEVKIYVKSGDGGDGCISFRREKFVPRGGPNGGNGGKGGDVILIADSQALNLYDLQFRKHFRATRGQHGQGSDCHGRGGEDCVVHVPPGTLVFDSETNELLADMDSAGATFIVAHGGRGGRGNAAFMTSTNRAPKNAEEGGAGIEKWLRLEMKMLADAGLVGYPSVGKSTLISAISHARPKIAPYPFTTLSPNLGTVESELARRFVVADLPGLIEGAHAGVGLGHKFLRHIERTRVIVHLLDMDPQTGRDPFEDFQSINSELEKYNPKLLEKPQVVAANKIDVPGAAERLKAVQKHFKKLKIKVFPISAKDGVGLDDLLSAVENLISV